MVDANGDGKVDYREFLDFTYNSEKQEQLEEQQEHQAQPTSR